MNTNSYTEQDWDNTHLLTDPLSLSHILGADASLDHPSLCRMMEESETLRMRYVWVLTAVGQPRGGQSGYIPESLAFVLEKRLCTYLSNFASLSAEKQQALPTRTTIVWNCKRQSEADMRTFKKNTMPNPDGSGRRSFVPNIGAIRGSKDWCNHVTNCHNLYLHHLPAPCYGQCSFKWA